jgi:membrane protein DedA with SNARE-associated domain
MRRLPRFRWFLLAGLLIVVIAWLASAVTTSIADVDFDGLDHPYMVIFGFVVFDALIPIFPSESLLNTASTLATQDGSTIEIWRVIVAGTMGAIIGDSLLYWISRTFLRKFMADRVAQAQQNEQVAKAFDVLSGQAPQLIVFGRFVPGMRFVVGATMGLTRHPYPSFLLWDALGSLAWAGFACISSALVATVINDQPVLSMLVSIVLTTALLGFFYRSLKEGWDVQPSQVGSTTLDE